MTSLPETALALGVLPLLSATFCHVAAAVRTVLHAGRKRQRNHIGFILMFQMFQLLFIFGMSLKKKPNLTAANAE